MFDQRYRAGTATAAVMGSPDGVSMVTLGFDLDEAVLQEDLNHPPDWSSRGALVELYFSLPVFLRIDSQDLLRSPEGWQLSAPILQFATAIPTALHQLTRSRDSVYDAPGVGPCVRFALVGPTAVEIDSQVSKSMAVVPRDALAAASDELVVSVKEFASAIPWLREFPYWNDWLG